MPDGEDCLQQRGRLALAHWATISERRCHEAPFDQPARAAIQGVQPPDRCWPREHPGTDDLPALCPRHPLPAPDKAVPAPVCSADQRRRAGCHIEAGDAIFAPRMKALALPAVVPAPWRASLAESTRRTYQRPFDGELDKMMVLAPTNCHGRRLRKPYGKTRGSLFTFLAHPEVTPNNNGSERKLRPAATYRKVIGGFRSKWGADLFANLRSVVGTASRRGIDAYSSDRRYPARWVSATIPGGLSRYDFCLLSGIRLILAQLLRICPCRN